MTKLLLVASLVAGLGATPAQAAGQPQSPRRLVPITTTSPEALTEFLRARDFVDSTRTAEALPGFRKAIALDPKFAQAHAYLGYFTVGPEGFQSLRRAVELAAGLPEAERTFIELHLAKREGDTARAAVLLRALLRLAPDDWRVSFEQGSQAFRQRNWEVAIAAYGKAVELSDGRSCNAYTLLGYAQAMERHYDLAIAAMQRCADLVPTEPNTHDSMGEVELAARRLDQAEAAFRRAVSVDPHFWTAWHGIATVRFFRGDWQGGYQALASARAAATQTEDRLEVDRLFAWALFAQGKDKEALARLDTVEKDARKLKAPYIHAVAALTRAELFTEQEQYPKAIAAAATSIERATSSGLPEAIAGALRRRALVRQALAEAKLGKAADAAKTLERLEAEKAKLPDDAELSSALHLTRGAVLLAQGDLARARAEYEQCKLFGLSEWSYSFRAKPEDPYCLWQLSQLAEKQGDAAGAEARRKALLQYHVRDPRVLYLRSRKLAPR